MRPKRLPLKNRLKKPTDETPPVTAADDSAPDATEAAEAKRADGGSAPPTKDAAADEPTAAANENADEKKGFRPRRIISFPSKATE